MAKLDISKLAARLGELNSSSGGTGEGTGVKFADVNDGRNQYRLLPGKEDPTDFFREAWVHYGVGKNGSSKGSFAVCPTTLNEKAYCPECALSKEFKGMSKKKDDKMDKEARQHYRRKRVYYNVVDRAVDLNNYEQREVDGELVWYNIEDDKKESPVHVLATGIGLYKDILGLIVDPEYGEVMLDPKEGLDIIVTKTGTGQFGTKYEVKAARKESSVGLEEWEDALNDLDALVVPKTAKEMEDLMEGNESGNSSDVDDDDEEEEEKTTPTKKNKASTKTNARKPEPEDEEDEDEDGSSDGEDEDDLQDDIQAAIARRKQQRNK